jgi:L-fuculose-phosphate aldolase
VSTTETSTDVPSQVLAAAKEMCRKGLVEGTSGNVSGRMADHRVCLTPSSLSYEDMALDDLVICDMDGKVIEGIRGPTSEKDLHLACYRKYDEVGGVIHAHATYASMFACARQPIPAAIEEFVVYIGGDVPVCDYKVTGSKELGEEVASRLHDRSAVLVASHGIVAIGANPAKALHAAACVERSAQIVWGARQLGGEVPLPEKTNLDFTNVYHYLRKNPMP